MEEEVKMLDSASKLTNYEIDILTDKEDSERRQAEFKEKTEALIKISKLMRHLVNY